jgi:hypothetical protein
MASFPDVECCCLACPSERAGLFPEAGFEGVLSSIAFSLSWEARGVTTSLLEILALPRVTARELDVGLLKEAFSRKLSIGVL